jgi:competence protein ComEC
MPAPFLLLGCGLAAGIWAGRLTGRPAGLWAALLGLGLGAAWLFYFLKKNRAVLAFILLTGFFLGALRYSHFHSSFQRNPLRALHLAGYGDIEGRLYRSPSRDAEGTYLFLKAEKIAHGRKRILVHGNVRVTVAGTDPAGMMSLRSLRPGDSVRISARLDQRRGFSNFNPPFLDRYLEIQGIHGFAFSKSGRLVEKLRSGTRLSPRYQASSLRQRFLEKIETVFQDKKTGSLSESGSVLQALLLGERGRLEPETNASLQASGLFHLIAISGAHIAVFTFLLFSILRLVRLPHRPASILLIFFLIFYAYLVEGRASVLRAVIMTVLFLVGKLLWRDVRLLNTISLSAFVLLLLNPASLWDAGFQLTFAATLSLILFVPPLLRRLPRLPLRLSELFAFSLAAHLGTAPFLASAFHRVTFSGLVLNLAAVPLMSLIMAAGYAFLPLAFIHPALAQGLGLGLDLLVKVFLALARLWEEAPFLSYRIPAPPALVTVLYVLFLLALLIPRRFKLQRAALLPLFLAVFAVLVIYPFPPRSSPGLRVTFLDVGQGDSILVEFPGKKKMLVDGGGLPSGDFDIGESVVSPVLWDKRMKRVDILVSTHAHPDHIGGLPAIARNFRIGEVWEGDAPEDDVWHRRFRKSLAASARLRHVEAGFVRRESGVRLEVLHPPASPAGHGGVDNETSLVLKLTYGRTAFLLAADIGRSTEQSLMEKGLPLESTVLKAGHHGSNTSTSEAFLSRVRPSLVVVTAGQANVLGFPHPAVLERCRRAGARVLRTDLDGAVEVTSDGRQLKIRTSTSTSFPSTGSISFSVMCPDR